MEVMIPLSVIIAALGLFIMISLFYGSDLSFFILFVIRLLFFIFSYLSSAAYSSLVAAAAGLRLKFELLMRKMTRAVLGNALNGVCI